MTEFDYYWEKAEFQDPIAHRMHVINYKNGIRDSVAFDEQYQKEASKLVFCLISNKLYSIFSICESPECGSDRLYARISAPIHFGVSKYNKI